MELSTRPCPEGPNSGCGEPFAIAHAKDTGWRARRDKVGEVAGRRHRGSSHGMLSLRILGGLF